MSVNHKEIAVNLIRRLPPSKLTQNLKAIFNLFPNQTEELAQILDQALTIGTDEGVNKPFIQCEQNRDGDSFRSHHTNKYYPEITNPTLPSPKARVLEDKLNYLFDEYLKMYYDGVGVLSCYCWESEDSAMNCCIAVKKELPKNKNLERNSWESINIVKISLKNQTQVLYETFSSASLDIILKRTDGVYTLCGTVNNKKTKEATHKITDEESILKNIGEEIEEAESQLRSQIERIHLDKVQGVKFYIYARQQKKKLFIYMFI